MTVSRESRCCCLLAGLHRSIPVTASAPPEICHCKTCSLTQHPGEEKKPEYNRHLLCLLFKPATSTSAVIWVRVRQGALITEIQRAAYDTLRSFFAVFEIVTSDNVNRGEITASFRFSEKKGRKSCLETFSPPKDVKSIIFIALSVSSYSSPTLYWSHVDSVMSYDNPPKKLWLFM